MARPIALKSGILSSGIMGITASDRLETAARTSDTWMDRWIGWMGRVAHRWFTFLTIIMLDGMDAPTTFCFSQARIVVTTLLSRGNELASHPVRLDRQILVRNFNPLARKGI